MRSTPYVTTSRIYAVLDLLMHLISEFGSDTAPELVVSIADMDPVIKACSVPGFFHRLPAWGPLSVPTLHSFRTSAIQAALDEVNKVSVPLKESGIANIFPKKAYTSSTGIPKRFASTLSVTTTPVSKVTEENAARPKSKRPSDTEQSSAAKKKRVLHDGYGEPSEHVSKPSSGSSGSTLVNTKRSSKKAADKPASVFLSKEQVRILELVQANQSVFYTGSAGVLSVST